MKKDYRGVSVPGLKVDEIVGAAELGHICKVEVDEWGSIPSGHMTVEKLWDLSERIRDYLDKPHIAGVVVTHGTDTLEETAFFLDLLIESEKPIVVTGAMRSQSELSWDGPSNLASAVRVALSPSARNYGTMVVLNETILAAAEANKTHTDELGTFQSPNFGPLGIVDNGQVLFYRRPFMNHFVPATRVESKVDLFKMGIGMDDRLIRYAVDSGAKGIVLEAFGRGNIPPGVVPGVAYAGEKGVPVVVASRCLKGRVLNTYGYEGSGDQLRRLGAIFADQLSGQKARIKLMLALGCTNDVSKIKEIFEEGRY